MIQVLNNNYTRIHKRKMDQEQIVVGTRFHSNKTVMSGGNVCTIAHKHIHERM